MRALLILPLTVSLVACASVDDGQYPSLARRAVELRAAAPVETSPTPALPEPATADLATAFAALRNDAGRGDTAFAAELARSRALIESARGSASESEAWVQAQIRVSALDSARAPSTLALAEVDRLTVERGVAGNAAGAAELASLQVEVAAMVERQNRTLDQLLAMLAR